MRRWTSTASPRSKCQVAQPIVDFGARRAVKRQREADLQSSMFSLEQVQIQARSEVRMARAAVEAQERALGRARESAQHANEVLKITIVAFDAGSSTNIEVIDAQRSARDQDTAVAQAEDAVRQARLELLVAIGLFPR
jgi:outer membrane protein TolC